MARSAVGEAIVPGATGATRPSDDVGLARTLASEGVTLQLRGSHEVTEAGQRSTVVLRSDGKHCVAAESWK